MAEALGTWKRSSMAGELNESFIGQTVTLMGWVQTNRDKGSLIFCDLRDRTGLVQIVFREEAGQEALEKAKALRREFCIAVRGEVCQREAINEALPTGRVEVFAKELKILSESETPPIQVMEQLDAREDIRLKYRYLDLRRPDMQRIFVTRSKAAHIIRQYLHQAGFVEVETPTMTKVRPKGLGIISFPRVNFPETSMRCPNPRNFSSSCSWWRALIAIIKSPSAIGMRICGPTASPNSLRWT